MVGAGESGRAECSRKVVMLESNGWKILRCPSERRDIRLDKIESRVAYYSVPQVVRMAKTSFNKSGAGALVNLCLIT